MLWFCSENTDPEIREVGGGAHTFSYMSFSHMYVCVIYAFTDSTLVYIYKWRESHVAQPGLKFPM